MKATAIWQLPTYKSSSDVGRVVGLIINDWQLSSVWTASTGSAYTAAFSYQNGGGNVNLTGSGDFGARIRIVGDPGVGCSSNQYQQFTAAAFQGPLVGSVGLESANNYLKGCFQSALDVSLARNIKLGGNRTIQLRVDMFNAPNQAIITGRAASLTLTSPSDPVTIVNNQYNADGTLNQARAKPQNAGFGAANAWQNPRTVQAYAPRVSGQPGRRRCRHRHTWRELHDLDVAEVDLGPFGLQTQEPLLLRDAAGTIDERAVYRELENA